MPDSAAPDIRFENISTSLGGEVVHQRLRAEFPAGQITVLMGPSGGGKTTLVRHLVGLVPPDTGRVLVGGRSVWDLDPKSLKALRAEMGVLLGGATLFEPSVFGSQTVRENLALPLHLQNVDEESIYATTAWWLRTLGLDTVADQLPEQLSARMRRRVALGAAMVGGRPLIVLDDVDLGLDAPTTARTVQAILTSQRRSGATMLITTHDIDLAKAFDGRLAVLANGRIVANGPVGELLTGIDGAEQFDRRFHVLDWMGPPMPEAEPPHNRYRELTFDPQLLITAAIALAVILAVVLALRATAGGPLSP
ncbi:ATP-binding cassette domain-containing protein [Pseudonocardia sp. KRD-184]|uniref:ATP-binding cassette domain-containing protein n=1 Tax=Pseudonocardia oceani TaxID=2792013 RepID=A0ABS6U2J7_9PSEU|nr:ATP-binding cassette domain-containing protein [Pseudonocardia oceani]MBW0089277.1 ATP-binding cassette domain-containing protein [Pseudonocardia oceani]MBW0094968.1 ATP-binding cassette domain-containing protein [Pseudonocardia oceani]MBW0107800.1 ATP-binding cassette domain-containing protein [Pseudonocardia oceani]MBW0121477.1 ATP-binding cassette domain-containing protein [Pseudonocardia oceani]MBW0126465.1 ATP-binding cassette domain-containing protein [Pseudonocardia oceani]